jgi:hypothetical protein
MRSFSLNNGNKAKWDKQQSQTSSFNLPFIIIWWESSYPYHVRIYDVYKFICSTMITISINNKPYWSRIQQVEPSRTKRTFFAVGDRLVLTARGTSVFVRWRRHVTEGHSFIAFQIYKSANKFPDSYYVNKLHQFDASLSLPFGNPPHKSLTSEPSQNATSVWVNLKRSSIGVQRSGAVC